LGDGLTEEEKREDEWLRKQEEAQKLFEASWPDLGLEVENGDYYEPDITMINQRKYKGIKGNLPAMKIAVKGTYRDDGILMLVPTQKLLDGIRTLEQWLLSLKRYDSGPEAVLKWLNEYYTDATNHARLVNEKKDKRQKLTEDDYHHPFHNWGKIIFTDNDDRWNPQYAYCGVFQPFLKLIGFGLQRFFDKYLPEKGYGLDEAMMQLLISGTNATNQKQHGDGDNNFISAISSLGESYPFRYWKHSHIKWTALRNVHKLGFTEYWPLDASTDMTTVTIKPYHCAVFDQKMLHSGSRNPNKHPSGRTFHVFKPVSPRDWMKGFTEHVLKFDNAKLDKFFPEH